MQRVKAIPHEVFLHSMLLKDAFAVAEATNLPVIVKKKDIVYQVCFLQISTYSVLVSPNDADLSSAHYVQLQSKAVERVLHDRHSAHSEPQVWQSFSAHRVQVSSYFFFDVS